MSKRKIRDHEVEPPSSTRRALTPLDINTFFTRRSVTTVQPPPSTPAVASTNNKKWTVWEWLNDLDDTEAVQLNNIINAPTRIRSETFLAAPLQTRLERCTNIVESSRDGSFYVNWVRCQISVTAPNQTGTGALGHPRLKVTIPRNTSAPTPIYSQLRASIAATKMDIFDNNLVARGAETTQVRLGVHHVAYNSDRSRPDFKPFVQWGKGASVSHFCDRTGCVRIDHLEFVARHAENAERQRCRGMILVISAQGEIVRELPCTHARTSILNEQSLEFCCRRLCVVPLGEMWPEMDTLWTSTSTNET